MKLLKYKDIISKSKEKVDELMAPVRTLRMRKKAEAEMLGIDEQILDKESKIQDICLEYPMDFDKLLDTLDEISILERRKEQYSLVIKDLFEESENV